jgi:HPt (histidine-containing phosphotransfer) domain-containing protein
MDSDAPMNFEKARQGFDGDSQFLLEVMTGFIDNVGNQIETIRRAIADGNTDVVWQEAHSIKGGAANLTAEKLSQLASELEGTGKSKNLKDSREVLNKLKSEYVNLKTYAKNCL